MKLAFCLFRYFPFGGLQRDFLRIAKECIRRGHAVDVFTMDWQGPVETDFNVHLVTVKGMQNHTRAKQFYRAIRANLKKYDKVIGFNKIPGLDVYYAADTCYQAKARLQHHFLYRLTSRYRHLVHFESEVFASHGAQILLISEQQQIEFMRYYQTPSERFHLLPPGIARDRIAPPNAAEIASKKRETLNIAHDDYLLLMVGSGFKTKGLDRIIRGVAALPPDLQSRSHIFVIGEDNTTPFLKLAKQLGVSSKIKFLGGRNDVSDYYLAADLLLHPAYNENTGTVLLEALASGLPVLTTDVCGYAYYITEANAGRVLASPFDQKVFNDTLIEMMLSPLRAEWGDNANVFAKSADIYAMPQHAVDYLESLS